MNVFESYKNLRVELNGNEFIELDLERGKRNVFVSEAIIYVPSLEKWKYLFPNLINDRESIVKFIKDFAFQKSNILYRYELKEFS